MKNKLATTVPLGPVINGVGNIGDTSSGDFAFGTLNKVLTMGIGIVTIIAILYFVLRLVAAAYKHISAGGDKASMEEARSSMMHAIIGLTIAVAAIFLADLVGFILGVNILNPAEVLINISGRL